MKPFSMAAGLGLMLGFCVGINTLAADDVTVGKEFQGKWIVTEIQANGATVPEGDLPNFRLTIDGDKMHWQIGEYKREAKITTLDGQSNPHLIDIRSVGGDQDGVVFEGIYELDGDRFRMCLNLASSIKDRPDKFETVEGSSKVIIVLKRDSQ